MVIQSEKSALMTPKEAAEALYIHINTLRRWANEGIIRQYRIGPRGDRRFIRQDIIHFIEQLRENGGHIKEVK